MSCVCDQRIFAKTVETSYLGINYCCPIGSSIINGTCGCDSSGASKLYVI